LLKLTRNLISLSAPVLLLTLSACDDDEGPTDSGEKPEWTQQESGTTEHLYDVVWGDSVFVAVGWSVVLTSFDGVAWSPQSLPLEYAAMSDINFGSVVWSESRQLFLAAGDDNIIMTSLDGSVWTARESGLSWGFIESATAFDTLLAVSYFNPVTLLVSGDGITWTEYAGIGPFDNFASSGSQLVAVGGQTGKQIYTSQDGEEWTLRHDGDSLVHCVARFETASSWIAAGHLGYFVTSSDGVTWTGLDAGAGEKSTLHDAVATATECIVVGSANGPGLIMRSTDGVQWPRTVVDTVGWLNGIAASPDCFVAVGDNGVILTRSATPAD